MFKRPDFEDLSPLKELWCRELSNAISYCKAHFEEVGHRYDEPKFFSEHTRAKLRELLEPFASEYNFVIDVSPLGKFTVYYRHFEIRLRKAREGFFPLNKGDNSLISFINHNRVLYTDDVLPGFSGKSSALYSYSALPGFDCLSDITAGFKPHLFAYYDITQEKDLAWLKFACPKYVSSVGIEWDWDKEVIPADIIPSYRIGETKRNDYPLSEREDLPYTLIDDESTEEDDDNSVELDL